MDDGDDGGQSGHPYYNQLTHILSKEVPPTCRVARKKVSLKGELKWLFPDNWRPMWLDIEANWEVPKTVQLLYQPFKDCSESESIPMSPCENALNRNKHVYTLVGTVDLIFIVSPHFITKQKLSFFCLAFFYW